MNPAAPGSLVALRQAAAAHQRADEERLAAALEREAAKVRELEEDRKAADISLPLLSVLAPPSLLADHPEAAQALEQNQHRLVTPFDIYGSLQHLLNLQAPYQPKDTMTEVER